MSEPKSRVVGWIEGTACEIEYTDETGEVVGYWAYGSFDPNLPYQGGAVDVAREDVPDNGET